MEASNQHGVYCSVSILRRAGYKMETLDVSSIDKDDSCTHSLGDSTNANSLRALVPVETRPSVFIDWPIDPLSLQIEEDCPASLWGIDVPLSAPKNSFLSPLFFGVTNCMKVLEWAFFFIFSRGILWHLHLHLHYIASLNTVNQATLSLVISYFLWYNMIFCELIQ